MPDAARNRQAVLEFFDTLNSGRVDGLRHHLAAGVIDHNKIIHGEGDEPGAAFDGFRQQLTAFPDLAVRAEQLLADGDQVVARLTVSGTHRGTHPRMPAPTHRRFEVEQIWIFTLTDGMIAEIRAVSDRLTMFQQLGWPWPAAG